MYCIQFLLSITKDLLMIRKHLSVYVMKQSFMMDKEQNATFDNNMSKWDQSHILLLFHRKQLLFVVNKTDNGDESWLVWCLLFIKK